MADIPVDRLTPYELKRLEEARAKCRADVKKAHTYLNAH